MSAKIGFRNMSQHLWAVRREVSELTPRQRRQILRKVKAFSISNCGFVEYWAKDFLEKVITEAKTDDAIARKRR